MKNTFRKGGGNFKPKNIFRFKFTIHDLLWSMVWRDLQEQQNRLWLGLDEEPKGTFEGFKSLIK